MRRFADQVVVVTGGANPLTEALLNGFQSEGAETFHVAFESDPIAFAQRIEAISEQRKRLDVLVTNHFLPMPASAIGSALQLSAAQWNSQQRHWFHAPYYASQAAAKIMLESGQGSIVHIGPVHGLFAQANMAAYCAAAGGLYMLTKALAVEWAAVGLRVNAIACGMLPPLNDEAPIIPELAVLNRIPMGRSAASQEIVQAVLFAAGDEASFMTGEVMRVDGGWTAYHLFVPFEGAF